LSSALEAQGLLPGKDSVALLFFVIFFQKKIKVKKRRHTVTPVKPFVTVCPV